MAEQDAVTTSVSPAVDKAVHFYATTYDILKIEAPRRENAKEWIGSKSFPRHCRFCLRREPDAPFTQEAHALPGLTGNRRLFTREECDDCNGKFGKLENDMGNFTRAERTFGHVTGRRRVPSLKTASWRIDANQMELRAHMSPGDGPWEEDEEKKLLKVRIEIPPYRPLAVYKAFLKMALSVMPERELEHFGQALRWLASDGIEENGVIDGTGFICYRTVGPRRFEDPFLVLLRRKQEANAPYASFIVTFGNSTYQIFLPSPERDGHLEGQDIYLPALPTPDVIHHLSSHGRPQLERIRLEAATPLAGEFWSRTLSYQRKIRLSP